MRENLEQNSVLTIKKTQSCQGLAVTFSSNLNLHSRALDAPVFDQANSTNGAVGAHLILALGGD